MELSRTIFSRENKNEHASRHPFPRRISHSSRPTLLFVAFPVIVTCAPSDGLNGRRRWVLFEPICSSLTHFLTLCTDFPSSCNKHPTLVSPLCPCAPGSTRFPLHFIEATDWLAKTNEINSQVHDTVVCNRRNPLPVEKGRESGTWMCCLFEENLVHLAPHLCLQLSIGNGFCPIMHAGTLGSI